MYIHSLLVPRVSVLPGHRLACLLEGAAVSLLRRREARSRDATAGARRMEEVG